MHERIEYNKPHCLCFVIQQDLSQSQCVVRFYALHSKNEQHRSQLLYVSRVKSRIDLNEMTFEPSRHRATNLRTELKEQSIFSSHNPSHQSQLLRERYSRGGQNPKYQQGQYNHVVIYLSGKQCQRQSKSFDHYGA